MLLDSQLEGSRMKTDCSRDVAMARGPLPTASLCPVGETVPGKGRVERIAPCRVRQGEALTGTFAAERWIGMDGKCAQGEEVGSTQYRQHAAARLLLLSLARVALFDRLNWKWMILPG